MENKRGISKIFNKNHKLFLIISIFAIITLVTGTSYAILKGTITSEKEHVIKTGNVTLEITEYYDSISKNIVMYNDTDGLLQSETYDFNIKNTGTEAAKYSIKLVNEATGETKLPDNYIKVGLEINGVEYGPMSLTNVNNIIDSGIISQNEIISYKMRLWLDREKESEITALEGYTASFKIEIDVEQRVNTLDTSGANKPELSDNMIPVYYDETASTWKKADKNNLDLNHKWYNYSEKMWANAVTVSETNRATYLSAKPGTAISMDDINTMLVWIPRYKYKVWNYNLDGTVTSDPQEIQIMFENDTKTTGDITCFDKISGTENSPSEVCKLDNKECTDNSCNGKTYTHPAFTFGSDELTGFWVGKFEVSSNTTCTADYNSAVGEGCNLKTIKPIIKPNVTSWTGAMIGTFDNNARLMNNSGNIYGFTSNEDTHVIKNMEWGAIAYLSHSKYGTCTDGTCSEIGSNSYINQEDINSALKTGCGPLAKDDSTNYGVTCNAYNTTLGKLASTTGNVYGIYDMNNGAAEYVMGNMVSPDGITMLTGINDDYSGYTGKLYDDSDALIMYTGVYSYPNVKYYDKYNCFGYYFHYNSEITVDQTRKLGEATKEVLAKIMDPLATRAESISLQHLGWYEDMAVPALALEPWIVRSGIHYFGSSSGIFLWMHAGGSADNMSGTRIVVAPTT